MEPRVSFLTLIVADLDVSRAFYVDGLGWPVRFEGPDVVMFAVADRVVLSLWDAASATDELGEVPGPAGNAPITIAHNVASPEQVRAVLEVARAAGARVWEPAERIWGGYTGYFADPDGFRWEVAWNPGEIGEFVLPRPDSDRTTKENS